MKKLKIFILVIILIIVGILGFIIYKQQNPNFFSNKTYEEMVDEANTIIQSENPDAKKSIRLYTHAFKNPNLDLNGKAFLYALRANAYYTDGQLEKAIDDTDKFISLGVEAPAPLFSLRGDIYRLMEKYDLSLENYKKAFEGDPTNLYVAQFYALTFSLNEQPEEAYKVIKKYFSTNPKEVYWDRPQIWTTLAVSALETHRCTEATVSAWRALRNTPTEGEDRDMLDMILSAALNDDECIDKETFIEDLEEKIPTP